MNRTMYFSVAAVLTLATGANAGIQYSSTVGDTSNLLSDFALLQGGSPLGLNAISGLNSSTQMQFGSLPGANPFPNGNFVVDVAATDGGSFYLGDSVSLNNAYFDAGDSPRPANGTHTLAFGNNTFTSNEVTLSFNPNTVTAFGFNYEDIGDVGATLTVTFSNGSSSTLNIPAGAGFNDPARDGFVSIVSDFANVTIGTVTLTQGNPQQNDGFSFYGFTTVQVVPVPTAALAGLGLLIPLGVARRIKRRR